MEDTTSSETKKLEEEIAYLTNLISKHKKSADFQRNTDPRNHHWNKFSTSKKLQRSATFSGPSHINKNDIIRSATYNPHAVRHKSQSQQYPHHDHHGSKSLRFNHGSLHHKGAHVQRSSSTSGCGGTPSVSSQNRYKFVSKQSSNAQYKDDKDVSKYKTQTKVTTNIDLPLKGKIISTDLKIAKASKANESLSKNLSLGTYNNLRKVNAMKDLALNKLSTNQKPSLSPTLKTASPSPKPSTSNQNFTHKKSMFSQNNEKNHSKQNFVSLESDADKSLNLPPKSSTLGINVQESVLLSISKRIGSKNLKSLHDQYSTNNAKNMNKLSSTGHDLKDNFNVSPKKSFDNLRFSSPRKGNTCIEDTSSSDMQKVQPAKSKYSWVASQKVTDKRTGPSVRSEGSHIAHKNPIAVQHESSQKSTTRLTNKKSHHSYRLDRRTSNTKTQENLLSSSESRHGNKSVYKYVRQKSDDTKKLANRTVVKSSQVQAAAHVIRSKYKLRKVQPASNSVFVNAHGTNSNRTLIPLRKQLSFSKDIKKSKSPIIGSKFRKVSKYKVKNNPLVLQNNKYKLVRKNTNTETHALRNLRNRSGKNNYTMKRDEKILRLLSGDRKKSWTSKYSLQRTEGHTMSINQLLGRRIRNLSKNKYKFVTSKSGVQMTKRHNGKEKSVTLFPSRSKLKLDRRTVKTPTKRSADSGQNSLRYVVIGGMMYRSTATSLKKSRSESKQREISKPRSSSILIKRAGLDTGKMKTVTVRGIKYEMDKSGKSLKRVYSGSQSPSKISKPRTQARIDIGGETFVQTKPGTLVRISNRKKRILASSALNRSIARVTRKKKPSGGEVQYCMFYNRFGRCNRGEKCSYVHDPERVAVCTRFLRGTCKEKSCPFSHKVNRDKMPVCSYFLRGLCIRDNCPYRHVNVNKDAEVCKEFLNGYCSLGEKCPNKHILECPEFLSTGKCSSGRKCRLLHPKKKSAKRRLPTKASEDKPARKLPRIIEEPTDNPSLPFKERTLPAFIALEDSDNHEPSSASNAQLKKDTSLCIKPRLSFSPMKDKDKHGS